MRNGSGSRHHAHAESGPRWHTCPEVYGPCTTVFQPLEPAGHLDGHLLRTDRIDRPVRIDLGGLELDQSPSLRSWRKRGAFNNAIGRSRGGQITNKIHALSDDIGRPLAFPDYPGNTHDLVGARDLIGMIRNPRRGRPSLRPQSLRNELAARRIKAVIPPNPARKHPHRYDKTAYKGRNVIDGMFCRLKDFRRIATRYDNRADMFLSAILIAAAISW